jgi:hypothetical protein
VTMADEPQQPSTPQPSVTIEQAPIRCINIILFLGAKFCPTYNSYQHQWRNTLSYIGSVAGLIAVIATGGTFIYSTFMEISHERKWHDDASVPYM